MERPQLRSIGLNDFIRWNSDKTLILSPKFQRRRVWPKKAKAFLIDTILRGLPIPKLYMRQHLDVRSSQTVHEIVDGQQRLGSVIEFHEGKLSLPDDSQNYGGKTFSTLPADAQKAFLTYEFSVDLLIDAADADVLDIFARINSHSVPLNAQEKRNAKFYGSFKNTVYALGFQHLEFWKKHRILSDAAVARMKEAELTSELLVAMVDGLQDKKKSLDSFYEKWDDRYPYKQKSTSRFQDIVDLIDSSLGKMLGGSNFRRPALFYSLFLVLYELRYGKLGEMAGAKQSFTDHDVKRLIQSLTRLDSILNAKAPPKEYLQFIEACQRQTDNIAPRRTRHNQILKEFKAAH
ncbi:MAG: DUF262 domain-containing protein [Pseudomonadota bacterium]